MGRYVHQENLGNLKAVGYQLHVYEESPTEFRPIVTATNSHGTTCEGYSTRRSFGSEKAALDFAKRNEDLLCKEALEDLKKSQKQLKAM